MAKLDQSKLFLNLQVLRSGASRGFEKFRLPKIWYGSALASPVKELTCMTEPARVILKLISDGFLKNLE